MRDSLRCIQVISGVLGRAGQAGQKKRLEDAKEGNITWLPPPGLGKPRGEEEKEKATAAGVPREKAIRVGDVEADHTVKRKSRWGSIDPEEEDDL